MCWQRLNNSYLERTFFRGTAACGPYKARVASLDGLPHSLQCPLTRSNSGNSSSVAVTLAACAGLASEHAF
jgi:hypothetical protein